MRFKFFILLAIFLLLPAGCARYPELIPGTVKEITGQTGMTPLQKAKARRAQKTESAVVNHEIVTIPTVIEPPPSPDYVVGPHDTISVTVSMHPELSSGGGNSGSGMVGSRVDGSGNIQVPLLGLVQVEGLTLPQIRERFQDLLLKSNYLKEPSVVVEVSQYKSHPLYLLGEFKSTGTIYMDRPLNLLQGISLGNGYSPSANLRSAHIIRDKKIVPVDIYELLTKADQTQNVWLKSGDTIFIPDSKDRSVLIFGAVKKGGLITIPPKGLSLLQAMATAELAEIGYNTRQVHVIRTLSTTRGELMVVDFDKILRGDAMPMMLNDGDIIYVPKSAIQNWNEAIGQMLPTLQAFGAILSPYVQLRYLFNFK